MTNRDKQMADIYLTEPVTKTEAYSRTHKVGEKTKKESVQTQASLAFRNPKVLNYLAKFSDKAEQGLMEVADYSKEYGSQGGRDGASYASVASSTFNSILDRVHGKATQRTEVTSVSTNITIDLTGGTYGAPPPEMLDQPTDE